MGSTAMGWMRARGGPSRGRVVKLRTIRAGDNVDGGAEALPPSARRQRELVWLVLEGGAPIILLSPSSESAALASPALRFISTALSPIWTLEVVAASLQQSVFTLVWCLLPFRFDTYIPFSHHPSSLLHSTSLPSLPAAQYYALSFDIKLVW